MPFCTLTESEVLDQMKYTFSHNESLPGRADLGYFYAQLPSMDRNNIGQIRDKTVRFGKIEFTLRLFGHRENADPSRPTRLEELHSLSVYACNDPLFAAANADRYFYSPSVGEETFSSDAALALAQEVAERLFAEKMQAKGYSYENTVIESWEYVGRGIENYTEYTFCYTWKGQNADNIKGIGYGKKLTICNEPYADAEPAAEVPQEEAEAPQEERAPVWPFVLGAVLCVAVIAAAVAAILIFV